MTGAPSETLRSAAKPRKNWGTTLVSTRTHTHTCPHAHLCIFIHAYIHARTHKLYICIQHTHRPTRCAGPANAPRRDSVLLPGTWYVFTYVCVCLHFCEYHISCEPCVVTCTHICKHTHTHTHTHLTNIHSTPYKYTHTHSTLHTLTFQHTHFTLHTYIHTLLTLHYSNRRDRRA
jgi:hypothetical protein